LSIFTVTATGRPIGEGYIWAVSIAERDASGELEGAVGCTILASVPSAGEDIAIAVCMTLVCLALCLLHIRQQHTIITTLSNTHTITTVTPTPTPTPTPTAQAAELHEEEELLW